MAFLLKQGSLNHSCTLNNRSILLHTGTPSNDTTQEENIENENTEEIIYSQTQDTEYKLPE